MEKLAFQNDYCIGAHPEVLRALSSCNSKPFVGYGQDERCAAAEARIRELIRCPQAKVHFLSGGTQANLTAIGAFLRPWESVLTAGTGHIHVHEAGSVEATGHKLHAVPVGVEGKLTPADLRPVMEENASTSTPVPRLVYISDATETGAVYTRRELEALSGYCRQNGLLLFLDGARLGAALASPASDLDWPDLARLTDAFYIGGTKNGAMFGEALVLVNPTLQPHFFRAMKQRGAVLAKGWLMGVQFETLLAGSLYLDIAAHADAMAARLQDGAEKLGYKLMLHSPTNQIFVSIPNEKQNALFARCACEIWEPDGESAKFIRFVTGFITSPEDVEALLALLRELQ